MKAKAMEPFNNDTSNSSGNILDDPNYNMKKYLVNAAMILKKKYSDTELLDVFFESRHDLINKKIALEDLQTDHDYYKRKLDKNRIIDAQSELDGLLMMTSLYAEQLRNRRIVISSNGKITKDGLKLNYKLADRYQQIF